MGRKKQPRPHRSGHDAQLDLNGEPDAPSSTTRTRTAQKKAILDDTEQLPFFVEVDRNCWVSDEHLDVSEIILTQLIISEGYSGYQVTQDFYESSKFSIRFCVRNVRDSLARIKLGHWPVVPATDISLEFVENCTSVDKVDTQSVILSGSFDGPDEAVSSLIHLASLKFITLRPTLGVVAVSGDAPTLRLRVQMLRSAFDACESLLDNGRQLWKKSMMNVMAWLRPEVTTSEARYRVSQLTEMEIDDMHTEAGEDSSVSRKRARFDAATFYEAIKPSKGDPMLEDDIPDLLPQLRPYQRRAAYWMVQREKGDLGSLARKENSHFLSPLCVPVHFADTCSKIFYNPFSGNVSMHPEQPPPFISGGVLADEMGLGKTVELLACIFAHRKSASTCSIYDDKSLQATGNQRQRIKRLKKERVECICGVVTESYRYKGLWVQCDICDAWQHADCVGYSTKGKSVKSGEIHKGQKSTRKKSTANIVERDGEHVCQPCSELIEATDSPVPTGATLIVCPAPILPQWHSEIIRHTNPSSLKICIYEGVRNTSSDASAVMDINELVNCDVVLTTYDVLKDDLSHDSDRHEGDRRFMRFQKRYPVIPTLLTRIYWWRICLDEAQMVESNAAAATEMALRLYSKHRWCITGTPIQRRLDDLYGLLRFLKASPFDVSRWWVDVIRDPYERRDVAAMEFTHRLFKQIMWRSSKAHVADELQLPPQEESVLWLSFSPIEEHFYQRQHETCVSYAREVIQSMKDDILKREFPGCVPLNASSDPFITHVEAAKLLNSLLKLRQACCHPQVGSSGLRSLQQTPMTMEEILQVLIGKTKIEGEEVLRRLVIALNALAAVAIIEEKFTEAVLLYEEALALVKEHSEDFRLDPLLNIHILHNLAEILPAASSHSQELHTERQHCPESTEKKALKRHSDEECDQHLVKRQKENTENDANVTICTAKLCDCTSNHSVNVLKSDRESESQSSNDQCLAAECENLKQKYLSVFNSKLSLVQQEFRKSYAQVCDAIVDRKEQDTGWWMEALDHAEQSKEYSNELIRKIGEAVSVTPSNSKSSKLAPCFRSITTLKYHIQTRLDLLETSRQILLDRVLEIDQTMDKPREEDIGRVRYCPICCQGNSDGPTCVHCELDELFQVYEARLFRLNKVHGGIINSAEEAVDLRKKNFALNRFLLSSATDETMKKRDVGEKVVVSKSPSELEVVLGVIKNYCKTQLGRDRISAATKQLHLLEGMRKEYAHARSLASAQAQVLQAHDEIKMATSRLRLRENDNDKSVDALGLEELASTNVHYSSEKFMSLTLLSHTKGKLRYLKGLVQSKQQMPVESPNGSPLAQETGTVLHSPTEQQRGYLLKANEEACPVCQEKLSNRKMVFSCGHVTCCKCLVAMTEHRISHAGKSRDRWVMCPTCRQHTDFGNIAYADDGKNDSAMPYTFQGHEKFEASITVKGSYGTKIEAITRRILCIKHTDPRAKVLVFSSWNDVLDVLGHAFAANGITHIRMKGGRKSQIAISKFRGQNSSGKEDSKMRGQQSEYNDVQVLLLLIQHGANGLNLLEAQHVVLVEPLLNPAAEAQAISRVHRIGQENKTLVHRFMVSSTVEEGIYKLNRSKSTNSFISGNKKNQDQPVLTLRDIESLFASVQSTVPESEEKSSESLMHLPPSMAAAIAAERRLNQ